MRHISLRLLCLVMLIGLVGPVMSVAVAKDPVSPSPALRPHRVVEIQLQALQHNDLPFADAGILQTWAFAHPNNKRLTGPVGRFAAMIKSPGYHFLINHRSHRIETVTQTPTQAIFAVTVVSAQGPVVAYLWEVLKVAGGDEDGSWMTAIVSPPTPVGEET